MKISTLLVWVVWLTCAPAIALSQSESQSTSESGVERKLERKLPKKFDGKSFSEIVKYLRSQHRIKIVRDLSVGSAHLSFKETVKFQAGDTSIRSVLSSFLDNYEITYLICDDHLLLLTQELAPYRMRMKVYPCRDIIEKIKKHEINIFAGGIVTANRKQLKFTSIPRTNLPGEQIVDFIQSTVQPNSWSKGIGTVESINGVLVINQTEQIHHEIKRLLAKIRKHSKHDQN